jgi:hydroxypyruvate reductase
MLANNDCHSLFSALGDSVITGPTMTNVNDFRAIFIEAPPSDSRGLRVDQTM